MSQKAVIMDIDGVLSTVHEVVLEETNKRYDTSFTMSDMVGWDSLVDKILLLPKNQETREVISKRMWDNQVIKKAEPTPGSQEFVRHLVKVGFKVLAATSRPVRQTILTKLWLWYYFPQIKLTVIGGDVHGRIGPKYKAVKKHNAVALIDDDGLVISDLNGSRVLPDTLLCLIDKPWNQEYSDVSKLSLRAKRFGFWPDNDYAWDQIFAQICFL